MRNKVKEFFRSWARQMMRWRLLVIIGVILMTVLLGSGLGKLKMDTSNESWFLPDDPLAVATDEFKDIFGNDDYIAILVEADDVFAPEVLTMIRDLGREMERKVPYAGQLTSITDLEFTRGTADGMVIEQVVPEVIPTDEAGIEAMRAKAFSKDFFVNRIVADDSKSAWVLMRMDRYPDSEGVGYDIEAAGVMTEIMSQERYQSDKFSLKSSGMPVVNLEKRNYMSAEAGRTMGMAFLISIVVLGVALRSLRGIIVPMFSAVCSIVWVFGAMGHLGFMIDPFVMTVPIYLGLAVSIGYSIHLFNFFERFYRLGHTRREAVEEALSAAGWPIFFTALTTIGSMMAFCLVPGRPVRWVGCTAGSGVVVIFLVVMCLTPAFLSFGREYSRKKADVQAAQATDGFFTKLADWIMGNSAMVMSIFVILVVFLGIGASNLRVDMDWQKNSGVKVPFLSKLDYISKSKIGTIYSYDLTVSFDEDGMAKDPQMLKNFDILAGEMLQQLDVKRVSSLLDIIKDMNQVMNGNDPAYYRVPDTADEISQLLFFYEMSGGENAETWVDYEYSTLRLSVDMMGYQAAEVERQMAYIKERSNELFPGARAEMVGTLAQFSVMANYVSRGEVISFLLALCVIGILMMIVFRSVRIGLVGMVPNLSPALLVAGIMGYAGIPLDMMTMTIIPMLLGLAVDDTIHFIAHAREAIEDHGYEEGIRRTFRTVGRAVLLTSVILITSFSVYLSSDHLMYFHLGALIAAGVSAALLADYFITPILLKWAMTAPADESCEEIAIENIS